MHGALTASGAAWCLIDITKFWDNYAEVQKTRIPDGDLRVGILEDDFIRRAMFIRKSTLTRVGLWDEKIRMREDWDLNIRLIAAGEPFVYLERPLYRYRRRPGSITTGDPGKLFSYTEQVLRKHHKRMADAGDRGAARIYAKNMWRLARQYFYVCRRPLKTLHCVMESTKYDFNLSRIAHPILGYGDRRKAAS
jgi:hypothetical protein